MLNLILINPTAVPPYSYPGEKSFSAESLMVKLDPYETECLELRYLKDSNELVLLRHGLGYPEGGEAMYSECLDGLEP